MRNIPAAIVRFGDDTTGLLRGGATNFATSARRPGLDHTATAAADSKPAPRRPGMGGM